MATDDVRRLSVEEHIDEEIEKIIKNSPLTECQEKCPEHYHISEEGDSSICYRELPYTLVYKKKLLSCAPKWMSLIPMQHVKLETLEFDYGTQIFTILKLHVRGGLVSILNNFISNPVKFL